MFGQADTGSISGSVIDAGNAAIAGAQVEAKQTESGLTLRTVSSDAGLYVFPNVPVGHYTVTAEKTGFKRIVRENIEIRIAQRQALDL
ncbi:MAG: carboxypeptidase-like regulatory domain-containing protein, partial [Bryobacteraceae bacterium]